DPRTRGAHGRRRPGGEGRGRHRRPDRGRPPRGRRLQRHRPHRRCPRLSRADPGAVLGDGEGTAQAWLRVSVDVYRLAVDSIRDYGIFMLDPEGRVATWNLGAERLKGYRPEEIIGKHLSVFYSEEDKAAGKPALELAEATRLGRFEDEGWRIRKDGSRFWANVVITALRGDDGQLLGFSKITRDLTERREHEERLRQSEESFRLLVEGTRDHAMFMLDA